MSRRRICFALPIVAMCAFMTKSAADAQSPREAAGKLPTVSKAIDLPADGGLPPIGPPHALAFPNFHQSTLPNGVRIVILEDHRQPLFHVGFSGQAGTILDPPGKAGLAYLTAWVLQAGTLSQDANQISDHVDALGASIDDDAGPDSVSVSLNGLSTHADELCEILSDITTHPKFTDIAVEGEKSAIGGILTSDLADAGTLASAALARMVYGGHAYGNYSHGTAETLNSVTPDDVRTFYAANYTPTSTTVVFQGDITPEHAQAIALKCFGGWTSKSLAPAASSVPHPVARRGTKATITIIDRPGSEQTEIRIGTLTEGRSNKERYAQLVASVVLGIGQSDSRLMREIRSKLGLAYGVASTFDVNREAGAFSISAATKNASTGEVVRLALSEVHKLASMPPPAAELTDRKTLLSGNFAISAASPGFFLAAVVYSGPTYLTRIIPRINDVTAADVSRVMAELQIDSAQIVLLGDAKIILPQVSDLGDVTVIEPEQLDLNSPTLRRGSGAN